MKDKKIVMKNGNLSELFGKIQDANAKELNDMADEEGWNEKENPTKFLTSQIKMNIDAVKLVREIREEFK